jgi:hypothetical protein
MKIMRDIKPWQVVSVGCLAARVQQPLHRVLRAMDVLRVSVAMTIDNIDYVREADAQRVAARFRAAVIEGQRIAGRAKNKIQARGKG